jgi:pimeloyl-ACP methyl ester carboxylesterase
MSSDDTIPGVSESTQWEKVGRAWLRILRFSPVGPADGARHGTALLVPGLGLPRYLLPLARLQAAQGVETLVLDALAWRGRGQRATPTIAGLAEVTAAWLQRREPDPLVVMGHSTGSQVALETVLRIQGTRGDLALVMAGPTFQPGQRSLRGLIPAALTAYRKDSPKELALAVRDVARARTDLVRIVQSGRRHRVDDRVAGLHVPLTVTAGEADSFASASWLTLLADRADAGGRAVVLPGSHNNPFTHPTELASLVVGALGGAGGTSRSVEMR